MKTRVAVLHEMGLPTPYAESKPLKIETWNWMSQSKMKY